MVLGLITQRGFTRLRGSVGLRLSLARPGKSINFVPDYFLSFIELLFLICFCFLKFGRQRLDATKRRGERHRNFEDFDSISKRSQNNKPGLIHTKRYSHTGNCRARSSRTQRDFFTSPRRTRKNKGVQGTQQLGCKTISIYQMIKRLLISEIHRIFIQRTTLIAGCE